MHLEQNEIDDLIDNIQNNLQYDIISSEVYNDSESPKVQILLLPKDPKTKVIWKHNNIYLFLIAKALGVYYYIKVPYRFKYAYSHFLLRSFTKDHNIVTFYLSDKYINSLNKF